MLHELMIIATDIQEMLKIVDNSFEFWLRSVIFIHDYNSCATTLLTPSIFDYFLLSRHAHKSNYNFGVSSIWRTAYITIYLSIFKLQTNDFFYHRLLLFRKIICHGQFNSSCFSKMYHSPWNSWCKCDKQCSLSHIWTLLFFGRWWRKVRFGNLK